MYSGCETLTHPPPRLIGVEADRALERPWRTCQQGLALVHVAAGCSFGCLFCSLQSRGRGPQEIQVRVNLPGLLESELATRHRNGRMPAGIAFGSTTDLFQPIDPLLAVVHEVLRVALAAGLEVHFQTRGLVPEGFGELLSRYKGKVHAQVVLFAMNQGLQTLYEPFAPSPASRLESIRRLVSWGVDVQARIEPLIPFISDTAGPLEELVRHLRSAGVRRASTAYLVLQPQVLDRLEQHLPAAHFHVIKGSFRGQAWKREGAYPSIRMLPLPTREQGYQRLRAIARRSDLDLSVCACLDAALGSSCAAYAGTGVEERKGQLDLFPTG